MVDGVAVRDVVRDVMAEVSPQELPLVAGLRQFDDETALRRLRRGRASDDPLGFGLGDVVEAPTPVVWLRLDEVGRRLMGAAPDGAVKVTKSRLRKLLRRPQEPVRLPELTPEQ